MVNKRRSCAVVVTSIALVLLSGTANAATVLSDLDLDSVSAGRMAHKPANALPQLPQLPQDSQLPQQATNNPAAPVPSGILPHVDGIERPPSYLLIDASLATRRALDLSLAGTAQQRIRTASLANALNSDALSSFNLFEGGALVLDATTTRVETNQRNDLYQGHRDQGFVANVATGGRESRFDHEESASSFEYELRAETYYRERVTRIVDRELFHQVAVGQQFHSLEELNSALLPLAIVPINPIGSRLFGFSAGTVLDAGWAGDWGGTVGYTGLQLYGIGVDIDSIAVGGTGDLDLLIGSTVTLPRLDLGDLTITACVGICDTTFWDIGSIGGWEVYPEFVLPGLGPRIEEINIGTGFAFSGGGTRTIIPGSIAIDGKAALSITPWARATLDLSEFSILGFPVGSWLDPNRWEHSWSFTLYDGEFDFPIFDTGIDIASGDIVGGAPSIIVDEQVEIDVDSSDIYRLHETASSSYSSTHRQSITSGGEVGGAAAEVLVFANSEVEIDTKSNIDLGGQAQQNMRLLNGINAVSSVAANAANIGRAPLVHTRTVNGARVSAMQQNQFTQLR